MQVDWELVTGPTIVPLTIAAANAEARIDVSDEDGLAEDAIAASRQDAEEYTSRGLLTQAWRLTQEAFTDEIWLPRAAPLQSVTSVKYYDTAGVLQTLATSVYDVKTASEPGRVVLKPLQIWPPVQAGRAGAVIIDYVVGWTAAADVPRPIVSGIRVMVRARLMRETGKDYQDSRSAAEACWAQYRVSWRPPTCPA